MADDRLPVIAFLPCRRGSERVKEKNTRNFAGVEGGLTQIKMEQLLKCPDIDSIIVSTDDPKVADTSSAIAKQYSKRVSIVERPPHLATSATSTDELIQYIPEIITEGIILWTHVTSPFVDSLVYTKAIQTYYEQSSKDTYDSLMSVTKIQKFLWNQEQPIK
jgi:CMP-N-acetylneuraminic acid synthetase